MSPCMMASLLLLLPGTSLAQPTEILPIETRIDRVISVVGDSIVTESDLRLEQELLRHDTISCPAMAAPQSNLLRLVEERRVLHRLAAERTLYVPTSKAVSQRIKLLSQKLGPEFDDFKKRWGLNSKHLDKLIRDRMAEEAYVEANLGRSLRAEQTSDGLDWEKRYRQAYRPWIDSRKETFSIRRLQDTSP
jgi:hypothetical protein